MFEELVDIKDNRIKQINDEILNILLKDLTTGKNILWGTNNYTNYGRAYSSNKEILPKLITKFDIIKPRIKKGKNERLERAKDKAEVFTPSWVCNNQNNLVDNEWFGEKNVFNLENNYSWITNKNKIIFKEKTWVEYVKLNRLEITCGEAPYIVSRYDTTSGEIIAVPNRIGLLDRKLRVINENVNEHSEWYKWVKEAYKSVYGFEWQGDNILIARENLLYTFFDNCMYKFGKYPTTEELKEIAWIISCNIFQMDGTKFIIPYSCKDDELEQNLLGKENIIKKCEGCKKNNSNKHNGKYVSIIDWKTNKKIKFLTIINGKENIRFDAIVGNPPYQIMDGGAKSSAKPVYHLFVNFAKKINPNYISMIIPSRWFVGGKGLDSFRDNMLNDKNISILHDYLDAAVCFPGVEIKGGVSYFLRNSNVEGKCLIITHTKNGKISSMKRYLKENDCDVFIRYNEAISILNKIRKNNFKSFRNIVNSRKPFGLPTNFKDYKCEVSDNCNIKLYANHDIGYININQIEKNKKWINNWKIYIPEAIGSGDTSTDRIKPIIGKPGTACTETYLLIGPFESEEEASNCAIYTQTQFFHFMLSLKKITQHTTSKVYDFVPIQNLKNLNDINWKDSVADIDKALFKKYNLTEEEANYIRNSVGEIVEVK